MRPQCGETHADARWQPLTCEVVRGGSQLGVSVSKQARKCGGTRHERIRQSHGMRAAAEKVTKCLIRS